MNTSVTLLTLTGIFLVAAACIPTFSILLIACAMFSGFFTLLSGFSK
jgi:hypothetical protein